MWASLASPSAPAGSNAETGPLSSSSAGLYSPAFATLPQYSSCRDLFFSTASGPSDQAGFRVCCLSVKAIGLCTGSLVQCASEANQGWSAASWLKLWLEEAGPPPGQPPSDPASASSQPSGQGSSATPGSGSGSGIGPGPVPGTGPGGVPLAPRTLPSSQPAVLAQANNPPGTPSQINECIIVQQIYCRSPCSSCRSGHCGLCLLRADFPRTHRCRQLLPALEAWRSLVTGFGPALALSKVFLWLCHLPLAFSGSASALIAICGFALGMATLAFVHLAPARGGAVALLPPFLAGCLGACPLSK